MQTEYAVGYRKPPVSGRFQKGQSGNPGGRPGAKKAKRRKFAEMLDAAMCESTEKVAMTPCASIYAASAKGRALDCVRGKTATIRLVFSLLDELDHVATDGRQRRGFDHRLEEMEAADEAAEALRNELGTEFQAAPVSQGDIEEEPRLMWEEYAGEVLGSAIETPPPNVSRPATAGRPDETHPERESERKTLLDGEPQSARSWVARSPGPRDARPEDKSAGHDIGGVGEGAMQSQTAASAPTEGSEQGLKAESERSFLAEVARNARKAPNEKEQRRIAEQAEMDRQRRAYESLPGTIMAFCDKHGYEYPPGMQQPKDAPAPLTEGASTNPHPEEGPHKRALRARFERLAWAQREEAARKAALAAKAEGVPMLRQAQHEGVEKTPRPEPVEGPEPLPDYAIWMRGQQAAP